MPFVEDGIALGAGNDEPVVAVSLIGDDRGGIEIFEDEALVFAEVEIECVIRRRDQKIGTVGALEFAAVIVLRCRLRFEPVRIVDGRTVAVVAVGEPGVAGEAGGAASNTPAATRISISLFRANLIGVMAVLVGRVTPAGCG